MPRAWVTAAVSVLLVGGVEGARVAARPEGWSLVELAPWWVLELLLLAVVAVGVVAPLWWRGWTRGAHGAAIGLGALGVGAAVATLPLSSGPSQGRGQPGAPTIVLITVDTLRRDHVSAYEDSIGPPTPHFDGLAADGVIYTDAMAPAPLTLPSHVTLLTGVLPEEHGVVMNGMRLPEGLVGVPELLGARGYATAAFTSSSILHGDQGLGRWFQVYRDELGPRPGARHYLLLGRLLPLSSRSGVVKEAGDRTVSRAIAWLRRQEGAAFLWVHLYDPHVPYADRDPVASNPAALPDPCAYVDHPAATRRSGGNPFRAVEAPLPLDCRGVPGLEAGVAAYAAEVAFADRQVGRLLESLTGLGRYDESTIVLVADHGESLTEHQQFASHQHSLYDPVVRVPLIVKNGERGVENTPVNTVVVAEILARAGGVDHAVPADALRALGPAPISRDTLTGAVGTPLQVTVRREGRKILVDEGGQVERYALGSDPLEIQALVTRNERVQGAIRLVRASQRVDNPLGAASAFHPPIHPDTWLPLRQLEQRHPALGRAEVLGVEIEDTWPWSRQEVEARAALRRARTVLQERGSQEDALPDEVIRGLEALGYVDGSAR